MGNDGLVIADSEPTTAIGKFTWLQILPDGTRKWFERSDSGWSLVKTEDAPALASDANTTGDGLVEVKNMKVRNGVIVDLEEE